MRAVVIGQGQSGCGFAVDFRYCSGFDVAFIGQPTAAARLRRAGHSVVRLTSGRNISDEPVPSKHTVDNHDVRRAADLVTAADAVGVAVGTAAFDHVAALIAAGLSQTRRQVIVITFEIDQATVAYLGQLNAGRLLTKVSALPSADPLSLLIQRRWTRLAAGQDGNRLLPLRARTCAWSPGRDATWVRAAS